MTNQQSEWTPDFVTGTFVEIDPSICQKILEFYEPGMEDGHGNTLIGEKDIVDYMYYTYDLREHDYKKYNLHPEIDDRYIRALTNYMRKFAVVMPDYVYEYTWLNPPDSDTLEYFIVYPDLTGDEDYEHFPGWRV